MTPSPAALLAAKTPAELRRLDKLLAGLNLPRPVPASFNDWSTLARPEFRWDAPHFRHMHAGLDRVTAGALKRLYFQVPIRHGKSESNTVGYIAYRLKRDPTCRIVLGSYNQDKATDFSRKARRLAKAVGVGMSKEKDGAKEWETAAGGGVKAYGAGAGVAGVNADLIVLDDPIGSRDQAESQAERDRVWDWITNDILARCEPHTAVTLTMSRWHTDDPAGRLLDGQAGKWEVVDLPCEAEANDSLGREVGQPLWPELRGREWIDEKRVELGAYGFASLLQGRPRPRGGGMFKWDWWKLAEAVPADGRMVRYWDLAGTDADGGNDPDYTVGALLLRTPQKTTYVVDVARFRCSVGQRDREIELVAQADQERYAGSVRWWFEQEAGVGGKDRARNLQRAVQAVGLGVSMEPATGAKEIRAEPLASAVEAGNVYLCPGDWRDQLRRECGEFPTGKHDDIVDSLAGAFNKLNKPDFKVL